MEENTEQRLDLTLFSEKIQELKERIASVVVGQEQTVDLVLTAVLANGHVLIEGVPGDVYKRQCLNRLSMVRQL